MYIRKENQIMISDDFFLPFGGKLDPENRWVKMASIVPWHEAEEEYAMNFGPNENGGEMAFPVRMAIGAVIIQTIEGLSDTQTVQAITENVYMQYFVGLPGFQEKPPFDPSLMVHFRKRFGKDLINKINSMIVEEGRKIQSGNKSDNDDDMTPDNSSGKSEDAESKPDNQGKVILDATCTPADIHHPTDIWLLNEAREHLEEIIDTLHTPLAGKGKKAERLSQQGKESISESRKAEETGDSGNSQSHKATVTVYPPGFKTY